MNHNLPMTFLFGFVCAIGIAVNRIGVKQKKTGDIVMGALIAIGSLLLYFLESF